MFEAQSAGKDADFIMRRKISPIMIISWLAVMALIFYTVSLYITGINSQRLHGVSIKDDVIAISDLTDEAAAELEKESPSPVVLAYIAGKLAACSDGAEMNEQFLALRDKTENALRLYAEALETGEYSESAVTILRADAVSGTDKLHAAAQYIMEILYSDSEKKMTLNYFDSRVITSRNYKLITSFVKSLEE